MADNMIDCVARAICKAAETPPDVRTDCEVLCSMCLDEARAAMEAHEAALAEQDMVIVPRSPTKEMSDAGELRLQDTDVAILIYQVMIDVALINAKQPGPPE